MAAGFRIGSFPLEAAVLRDLVAHLDGTSADDVVLAHSAHLARMFDLHVLGLYANVIPQVALAGAEVGAAVIAIEAEQQEARETGQRVEDRLRTRLAQEDFSFELRREEVYEPDLGEIAARYARLADLFVTLRPYGEAPGRSAAALEAALFGGGHAVYVASEAPRRGPLGTVLVAWSDTTEASRATAAAMPFLRRARNVIVATAGEATADPRSPLELLAHLRRHGIAAELHSLNGRDVVSDTLLAEAHRIDADLVVMGGYGHSRLRQWAFGGTTRDFLSRCSVPMLMAH